MQLKTELKDKRIGSFSLNIGDNIVDAKLDGETKISVAENPEDSNNWLLKVDVTIAEKESDDFRISATVFYNYIIEFDDKHEVSEDFYRNVCLNALDWIDSILDNMGYKKIGFVH